MVINPFANAGDAKDSLISWKTPRRRKWQLALVFLPVKSHGQRSLAGCSLWGRKESDIAKCKRMRVHIHTHMHAHTHTRTHAHTPHILPLKKSVSQWFYQDILLFFFFWRKMRILRLFQSVASTQITGPGT